MSIPFCIVVAWHNQEQIKNFSAAWNVKEEDFLVYQQDKNKEGCAVTKNKGIARARERDPEVIIVLDDDCYPHESWLLANTGSYPSLERFAQAHIKALEPQEVELFEAVTDPPSRGTPYYSRTVKMPVAASMGFWTENPDYDAVTSLVYHQNRIQHPILKQKTMFWRFFPLSGMNLAWREPEWRDCAKFVEGAERWDDVWMGYPWQYAAYKMGFCFNLSGPMIRHVRQSNVWHNLRVEAENMEKNETYWKELAGFA